MPAALEEYADIIDGTINNRLFYEHGGVHVVDVPLGAVLILLQELLHHEQDPEKHIEAGGVEFLAEEGEDVRADGGVVAAGAARAPAPRERAHAGEDLTGLVGRDFEGERVGKREPNHVDGDAAAAAEAQAQ